MRLDGRVRVLGVPIVENKGTIRLGAGCDLRSVSEMTALGVLHPCIFRTLTMDAVISVGMDTGISGAVICAKKSVIIGDRVQIGSGSIICDTDFHSLNYQVRGTVDDFNEAAAGAVQICDDCFIGARSIILKGVMVGARSIVGAGSLVVSDVPADSVACGNPARVIRRL